MNMHVVHHLQAVSQQLQQLQTQLDECARVLQKAELARAVADAAMQLVFGAAPRPRQDHAAAHPHTLSHSHSHMLLLLYSHSHSHWNWHRHFARKHWHLRTPPASPRRSLQPHPPPLPLRPRPRRQYPLHQHQQQQHNHHRHRHHHQQQQHQLLLRHPTNTSTSASSTAAFHIQQIAFVALTLLALPPASLILALLFARRLLLAASAGLREWHGLSDSPPEHAAGAAAPPRLFLAGLMLADAALCDAPVSAQVWQWIATETTSAAAPVSCARDLRRWALDLLAFDIHVDPREFDAWVHLVADHLEISGGDPDLADHVRNLSPGAAEG
ncbi:hypothetical protein HDU84_003884 [Entophlyctis sp. JEL0112]|nr:hypothetical protein HDU84_003884 [Entophlyctis sp. JEL0112]